MASAGMWYAVNTGLMKGSPRFGAFPNMLIAGFVGYFIGKVSYRQKCIEKFMQIPDSKIGQMLRENQGKSKGAFGDFDPGFGSGFGSFPSTASSGPGASERGNDGFSDISPRTYADLDIDRPLTNFDDSFSSNNFNSSIIEDNLPATPPSAMYSYDELRRKNREEYEQSRIKPYPRRVQPSSAAPSQSPDPPPESPRIWDQEPPPRSSANPSQSWRQKNAYGDVWEK
nr:PREDICTED: OCIA domain-containing protein 1 isoform X2 [Bemisia tabaci]